MKRSVRYLLLGFAVAVLAATGFVGDLKAGAAEDADLVPFIALLTGGQEVPANMSKASGVAFMTFDEGTKMLKYSITYSDEKLSSFEVAAHFHASAIPGVAAPVAFPLMPAGSPKVGEVGPFTLEQAKDLKKGLFYINIHTTLYPGGEIRGQVLPVGKGLEYDLPEADEPDEPDNE
ncbi:MAG: CHRD domain-containing protein [Candidatus Riflebacteria bacterium]|nr:CHRD domain-containing protein [Candidatus Riflebacteria bacterium]